MSDSDTIELPDLTGKEDLIGEVNEFTKLIGEINKFINSQLEGDAKPIDADHLILFLKLVLKVTEQSEQLGKIVKFLLQLSEIREKSTEEDNKTNS